MKRKVLITGGLGYLGGRIALHIEKNTNFSIRISARPRKLKYPSLSNKIEIFDFDLETSINYSELCDEVETIVHLAGLNAKDAHTSPERANLINVDGTNSLINAATKTGVKRFIYISTAHIYGSPLAGKVDETKEENPQSPYAQTHFLAEKLVLSEKKLEGIVLRLSNVIGSPADKNANCWTLVANELCRTAITTQKIELRGDGQELRDFICMRDVIAIIELFLNIHSDKLSFKLFNIASGQSMRTIDLAHLIASRAKLHFGGRQNISYQNYATYNKLETLNICINRLNLLGYSPSKKIVDEVDSILMFCKKNYSKEFNQ